MAGDENALETAGDIYLKCCDSTKIKVVTNDIGDARVQKCPDCSKASLNIKKSPVQASSGVINPLDHALLYKENECLKRENELLKKYVLNLEELVQLQKSTLEQHDVDKQSVGGIHKEISSET
ncbi:hypothetical protein FQR65_LT19031 [Abscondita terminalis]|nr:hypothetical protein FQR65_LT19031 [Abscondita terminalis]